MWPQLLTKFSAVTRKVNEIVEQLSNPNSHPLHTRPRSRAIHEAHFTAWVNQVKKETCRWMELERMMQGGGGMFALAIDWTCMDDDEWVVVVKVATLDPPSGLRKDNSEQSVDAFASALLTADTNDNTMIRRMMSALNCVDACSSEVGVAAYCTLKQRWQHSKDPECSRMISDRIHRVEKDVVRTDRQCVAFHAAIESDGSESENLRVIESSRGLSMMRNILVTYACFHVEIGYVQVCAYSGAKFILLFGFVGYGGFIGADIGIFHLTA